VEKTGLLACTRHATGMSPLVKDTISVPSHATSNQIPVCVSHTLPVCTYTGGVTCMQHVTDTYLITKKYICKWQPKITINNLKNFNKWYKLYIWFNKNRNYIFLFHIDRNYLTGSILTYLVHHMHPNNKNVHQGKECTNIDHSSRAGK
jgi:hypothetical protein